MRVLTVLFLEVTMKVNPLVARSLVKRWSEQQVEPVRTTENGSQNFHIVVDFRFYILMNVIIYGDPKEVTWLSEDDPFTQQHSLDLPQPLPLMGTRQPVQELQGRMLNVGGKLP